MTHDASIGEGYVHYIPPAPHVPDFHKNYNYVLVETLSQLVSILSSPKYCAYDLETSSLDPEQGFIVGVALSMDGKTGYYVPIKHISGPNLGSLALDAIYQHLRECKKVFFFNYRFDARFTEFAGYDMSPINYYDVSISVNHADSNQKSVSLKWAEKHFLGWDAEKFDDVLGANPNLYYVDPKDVLYYAATDALGTFNLFLATHKYYEEAGLSAKLDSGILYYLMKCEDQSTKINYELLETVREEVMERLRFITSSIYTHVGYSFSINSPAQLSDALKSLGLDTKSYSKTGHMRTGEEHLRRIEDQHPVLPLLCEFTKLHKSVTSYLQPISEQARSRGGRLRFAYITGRVPTGRLASGSDKKNTYFAGCNIQSVTKPQAKEYRCKFTGREAADTIFGWTFSEDPSYSDMVIEGYERRASVRRAFEPEEDHYWVSIDYSSQELRIPSLLSGEPTWLNAFKKGEDIHKSTAIAIYGEENYNKDKRKMAKIGNFGILYGQTPYSFSQKHNISLTEAEEFFSLFWGSLKVLKAWKEKHVKKARKEGTVYTFFGRPRRVRHYFESPDTKTRAFAYRTAINTVIQGGAADVFKVGFTKVCKNVLFNPKYQLDVAFRSAIHDEINYTVKKSRAREIIPVLARNMVVQAPNWQIPMTVEVSIGTSWGFTFPFEINEETGNFTPKYEKV